MKENLPHRFLVRLGGEISLKGKKTRHRFVDRLVHNLADAFTSHDVKFEFHRRWSRLLFSASSAAAGEIASRVFGVHGVAPMERRPWGDLSDLLEHGEQIFTPMVAGRTFAVRFHKGERSAQVPFGSQTAERELGSRLIGGSAGVDLKAPEVEAHVELDADQAYFYGRPSAAEGGLPIATEGRALALVSGGFDSPVAAWAMLRRGVRLDYLFFNLGGEDHQRDVLRVMKVLADRWSYGYRPRLLVVDFRPVVEELRRVADAPYWQVLLKRQMMRLAAGAAAPLRALALVTGEAVGQVSSQTLHNLTVISRSVELPILRPLAAWNKEDIVDLARRIGTHDISRQVPEYCGLAPGRPVTHAKLSSIEAQEKRLEPALLARLFDQRATIDLRVFELSSLDTEGLEVEEIPGHAVVLDLRTAGAFKAWHHPRALRLPYPEALESFRALDPAKLYVAYCEVGLKSAHLAEAMQMAGFRARHVRGGLATVRKSAAGGDPALHAVLSPVLRD